MEQNRIIKPKYRSIENIHTLVPTYKEWLKQDIVQGISEQNSNLAYT